MSTETTCYLISYDLRKQGQDYQKLYEAIDSLAYSKKILESFRFVKSARSLDELFKLLRSKVDANDGLYVTKYSGNAQRVNVLCKDEEIKGKCS